MSNDKLSRQALIAGSVGFVLNLLLGIVYAWSIFVAPLEAQFGWARTETSVVFSVSMACLCMGHLLSGVLLPRTSPRFVLLLSATLSGIGFLASAIGSSLPWFVVSYGVCCGVAVGLGANSVLSTTLLWFPNRRGVASGVLLAGVGLGSLVLGMPVTAVIGMLGWQAAFVLLGVVFALALGVGAFVLKRPVEQVEVQAQATQAQAGGESQAAQAQAATQAQAGGESQVAVQVLPQAQPSKAPIAPGAKQNQASIEMDTPHMLRTGSFWAFFCWIVLIGVGGLALISNAVPAAAAVIERAGANAEALVFATAAMGLIGVANSAGRLISGWLWDHFGYRVSLVTASTTFFVAMLLCAFADGLANPLFIIVGFLLLGASYGASVSAGSALIGSFFGMEHYPMNYAVVSLNILVASLIGPVIASTSWDYSGSYFFAYLVLALVSLFSLAIAFCLKAPRK